MINNFIIYLAKFLCTARCYTVIIIFLLDRRDGYFLQQCTYIVPNLSQGDYLKKCCNIFHHQHYLYIQKKTFIYEYFLLGFKRRTYKTRKIRAIGSSIQPKSRNERNLVI